MQNYHKKIPSSSRYDNSCPLSHALSHVIFTFYYRNMLENAKLTWKKTILIQDGHLIQVTVHHGKVILWPLAAYKAGGCLIQVKYRVIYHGEN